MKFIKLFVITFIISFLSGCTGHIYNNERNCSYDYFLHPDVSISKLVGGCGAVTNHK